MAVEPSSRRASYTPLLPSGNRFVQPERSTGVVIFPDL
jgi:hypothetical protein